MLRCHRFVGVESVKTKFNKKPSQKFLSETSDLAVSARTRFLECAVMRTRCARAKTRAILVAAPPHFRDHPRARGGTCQPKPPDLTTGSGIRRVAVKDECLY